MAALLLIMLGTVARSLATAATAPFDISGTIVFYNGLSPDEGVYNYRIPAVVQTKAFGCPNKGCRPPALVAFAEARHGGDSSASRIAVRTSFDGGDTWSEVSFAAGSENSTTARESCKANRTSCRASNPTVTYDEATGEIVLIYVVRGFGSGEDAIGNGIVKSTVNPLFSASTPLNWSAPLDISADFGAASGSMPGPGTALTLEAGPHTGRLLVVSHHGPYQRDYVSLSDDHGASWRTISTTFPGMDEAALTQLPNGSVLLNMRHRQSPKIGRGVAVSDDGGETFGPIYYDATLISPVCQASIVSFDDVVYFSNPASTSGRSNLTIRMSHDSCKTWSSELLVEAGKSEGYSCLVQSALNHFAVPGPPSGGILYEAVDSVWGDSIKFARFPVSPVAATTFIV